MFFVVWGRYVVLPRPVCFEKGVNYTVRLELPQYTSSDSEVESPYTLIDSVSAGPFPTGAGKAGQEVCIFLPRGWWRGLAERLGGVIFLPPGMLCLFVSVKPHPPALESGSAV